jgi:hypothetical protein
VLAACSAVLPTAILHLIFRYTDAYPHGKVHLAKVLQLAGPCKLSFTAYRPDDEAYKYLYQLKRRDGKYINMRICRRCRSPMSMYWAVNANFHGISMSKNKSSLGVCGDCIRELFY